MDTLLLLLLGPSLLILAIASSIYGYFEFQHRKNAYYLSTKHSLLYLWTHRGEYGEFLTYKALCHMETTGAKFLFNCYLPKDDGATTEIDMIMIDGSGIYVFESKNYSGWIFGDEKSKYWMQTLPNGRRARKNQFLNPILQNKLHISCLQKYLNDSYPVFSVIVFSNRCTFKKMQVSTVSDLIVQRFQLVEALQSNIGSAHFSNEQIQEIYEILYPCTQVSDEIKQQHIDRIRQKLDQTPPSPKTDQPQKTEDADFHEKDMKKVCPKCGALLTVRKSRAGVPFLGCSAYPNCRYTEKVDG